MAGISTARKRQGEQSTANLKVARFDNTRLLRAKPGTAYKFTADDLVFALEETRPLIFYRAQLKLPRHCFYSPEDIFQDLAIEALKWKKVASPYHLRMRLLSRANNMLTDFIRKTYGRIRKDNGKIVKESKIRCHTNADTALEKHNTTPDPFSDPALILNYRERESIICNILKELSPDQRKVTSLLIKGLSPAKIAQELKIDRKVVNARIKRARDAILLKLSIKDIKHSSPLTPAEYSKISLLLKNSRHA